MAFLSVFLGGVADTTWRIGVDVVYLVIRRLGFAADGTASYFPVFTFICGLFLLSVVYSFIFA